MRIKHIIFDVGNVLVSYFPDRIIDGICPGTPYKSHYLDHLFLGPFWDELDRGVIADKDLSTALKTITDPNGDTNYQVAEMGQLIQSFAFHLTVIQETQALFMAFHRHGVPLYILSNFQEKPFEQLKLKYPFIGLNRGEIVSGREKLMKPESAIYDALYERFGLAPETCLFIDDRDENIQACKATGMPGIVYRDPSQLRTALKDYEIEGFSL